MMGRFIMKTVNVSFKVIVISVIASVLITLLINEGIARNDAFNFTAPLTGRKLFNSDQSQVLTGLSIDVADRQRNFIKLSGISGQVKKSPYQNWSEVIAFEYALENENVSGQQNLKPGTIRVIKRIDTASTDFTEYWTKEKMVNNAVIECTMEFNNKRKPVVFLKLRLEDVKIEKIGPKTFTCQDGFIVAEELILSYQSLKGTYYEIQENGSSSGPYNFLYQKIK
jgi:type VI protein secretion system component Hcp